MSHVLEHIYNACDPLAPASAEYYVDSTAVRGTTAVALQFQRDLSLSKTHLCLLFSGHVGGGKSSELEHLRQRLNEQVPSGPCKRYLPILMNAGEYLDDYDVTPVDILLAIVAEVGATFEEQLKIGLKDSYFEKRLREIGQTLLTDVDISEGEVTIPNAKTKIRLLKKDPSARDKVRAKLIPQMTTVLTEINSVFDEARVKLRSHKVPSGDQPYFDFVLIVDDLEKVQRVDNAGEGEASHRQLFIERAPQLTELKAHVIYTIPLALVRSHGPQLSLIYGAAPVVLPMIKVHPRSSNDFYEAGRECLIELVKKRAGSYHLNAIIDEDALDWLIRYSGGHVRNLMTYLQRSASYVDAAPINLAAAKRALSQDVALFSTSIRAHQWALLAALDASENQWIDNNDPDVRELLVQNCILEYLNGGDESTFDAAAPWYAVNPIVRELSQFKRAASL